MNHTITRTFILACMAFFWLFPGLAQQTRVFIQAPLDPALPASPDATVGYLSIPAAAFLPDDEDINFENHGRYLINLDDYDEIFRAAVELPHGVSVTRFSAMFYGYSSHIPANYASVFLDGYDKNSMTKNMAGVMVGASGYWEISEDTSITNPVIDNYSGYHYQVELDMPHNVAGEDYKFGGVIIQYLYPTPQATHDVLHIPASDFRPATDPSDYHKRYYYLQHHTDNIYPNDLGFYQAPVNLPQGANVNGIGMDFVDADGENITIQLLRASATAPTGFTQMASLESNQSSESPTTLTTSSVTNPTIDTNNFVYFIDMSLPRGYYDDVGTRFMGATVNYDPPGSSLTQKARVSSAAFIGFYDDIGFYNYGYRLFHLHGPGEAAEWGVYVAPIFLPHSANVTKMNAIFYDDSVESGQAFLIRTRMGENVIMASAFSPGNNSLEGFWSIDDTSIQFGHVDNSQYAYYVYYYLPVGNLGPPYLHDLSGVSISVDYTMIQSSYLPLMLK